MAGYGAISFDAKDIAGDLTVTVTIRRGREWRVRLWVATQLIRLATWIAWTEYEIIDQDTEGER